MNIPFTIYFWHFDKNLHPETKGRIRNVISLMPFFFEFQVDFMARGPVKNLEERKKERKSHKSLCGPLVAH